MSIASWVTCYGILSAYCLAGSLMEHFAVISGWSAVDAASFPAVHKAQGNGVAVVYVIPKITLTIFVLVFVALRPAQVSMSLLVASLAALAISWAATGAHQLPIQRRAGHLIGSTAMVTRADDRSHSTTGYAMYVSEDRRAPPSESAATVRAPLPRR